MSSTPLADDLDLDALADLVAPLVAARLAAGAPAELLTPAEAARRAGVHAETIRRAIRSGALSASRVGRSLRVSPEDLDAWLRPEPASRSVRRARRRRASYRPLAASLSATLPDTAPDSQREAA